MLRRFSIFHRLTVSYAVLLLLVVGLAAVGVMSAHQGRERLRVVYEERAVPVELLSRVNYLMQRNRVLLMDMLVNPGSANVAKRVAEAEVNSEAVAKALETYAKVPRQGELNQLFDNFLAAQNKYQSEGLSKAMAAMKNADFDEAQFLYLNKISPLAPPFQQSIDQLIAKQVMLAGDSYHQARTDAETTIGLSMTTTLCGLLMGMVLSWRVGTSITRPLRQAETMAAKVAEGDLNPAGTISGQDEMAHLGQRLETMRSNLSRIVTEVREGSALMAHSSAEISTGVTDLSNRTEQQASSLQEARATLENLVHSVAEHANVSAQAGQLTRQATDDAKSGGQSVKELVHRIESVDHKSRKISEITSVIDSIAFQTNILALNAAVEAARAGEQGRGFAVVASEVRNLAQRSASAASEIKVLVTDAVESVQQVTGIADDTGQRVARIVDQIDVINGLISQLNQASTQQSEQLGHIHLAIRQIDDMTQQNAALVEENAAAAMSLRKEAAELDHLVGVFRTAA